VYTGWWFESTRAHRKSPGNQGFFSLRALPSQRAPLFGFVPLAQPNNLPNISKRLFRDVIAIASYTPSMSPLLEDAQRVHDMAGLSDRMIAAATGAKPSTVRGWLAGRSEPTGARAERLIELAEMIKRLALVVRPESIPVWLQRPILALDDEKPIELIARGEYRRVAKLIAEIEYPGVS
jgi:hypothetical protein